MYPRGTLARRAGALAAPEIDMNPLHAPPLLLGDLMMEIVNDRTRLIQIFLVLVVGGIAILWWRR